MSGLEGNIGDSSGDFAYLEDINANFPERLKLLQELRENGVSSELIFRHFCNNLGELVYMGPQDLNSLSNRVMFAGTTVNKFCEGSKDLHFQGFKFWDPFYSPSRESVEDVRELVSLGCQEVVAPKLETPEDYMAYLDAYSTEELNLLLENLGAVELTRGCNAPCRSICGQGVEGKISSHVPAAFFEYFLEKVQALDVAKRDFLLVVASDLKYYGSVDKSGKTVDGVDAALLMRRKLGNVATISTAFGLDKRSVNFLYRILRNNLPLQRISRLASGFDDKNFELLWGKLEDRAKADGITLNADDRAVIYNAFLVGDKKSVNKMAGNAISNDTKDCEVSDFISSFTGVRFRAGKGFEAVILIPCSKAFPNGEITFPLHPNSPVFKVPRRTVFREPFFFPHTFEKFIPSPDIIDLGSFDRDSVSADDLFYELYEITNVIKRVLVYGYSPDIAPFLEKIAVKSPKSYFDHEDKLKFTLSLLEEAIDSFFTVSKMIDDFEAQLVNVEYESVGLTFFSNEVDYLKMGNSYMMENAFGLIAFVNEWKKLLDEDVEGSEKVKNCIKLIEDVQSLIADFEKKVIPFREWLEQFDEADSDSASASA